MPIALHPAGLRSQSHHGVGARLVRRLGGAVRSLIVSGIAGTRRPAMPQTSRGHAAAQYLEAAAPRRVPVPRPSRLLARLFARRRRRPACRNQGDKLFTPQEYPQLSPKACAVLNKPLKDCDPKTLELLVSALVQHINQVMPTESGIADPAATLPNLWHRLNAALADTPADISLPATPEAAPATPADAVPDAPVASPHPPASPTGPRPPAKDAPRLAPLPRSAPPASDATITAAVLRTPPEIAAPSRPVVHRSRSFLYRTQSSARWRRCDSQPSLPRRIRVYLCASVVPFPCCHYTASTGPP